MHCRDQSDGESSDGFPDHCEASGRSDSRNNQTLDDCYKFLGPPNPLFPRALYADDVPKSHLKLM